MASLFTHRLTQIHTRQWELKRQILNFQKEQTDSQAYANAVASGMTMAKLLSLPSSKFNEALAFTGYAKQGAASYVQQQLGPTLAMAQSQGIFAAAQPQQQQQYKEAMAKSLYDQGIAKFSELEKNRVGNEDLARKTELDNAQEELDTLNEQEPKVKEELSREIKSEAGDYQGLGTSP